MNTIELIVPIPIDLLSWKTLLFITALFIYGSIPFAFIFTFLFTRKKLNETGTGNIGVANAFGVGGLAVGFLTVLGDASIGILPLLVSHFFYSGSIVMSLLFITVGIIGHAFSFFLKGRGGQGDTILMWALLILSPYTFLLYVGIAGIAYILIRRRRRLSKSLGYAFLPLEILLIEQNLAFIVFGVFMALLYILRYNPQRSDYNYYKSKMRFLRFLEEKLGKRSSLFFPLGSVENTSNVGFKAYSLHLLKKSRLNVPETYLCPFSIFNRYREGDPNVINELRNELQLFIKENKCYCVRSSANLEDSETHSFAGQFLSYLNIKTTEEIIEAIINVWESIESEHLKAYLTKIDKKQNELQIAVIVQEMINSRYSGVVFTKNPITGFDEIIIEAVSGLGDRLNEPDSIVERWVYKWGNWLEKPEGTRISEEIINTIISQALTISKKYGNAVDLEWAYDGDNIYWLQLRPITSLRGVNIYSNKISKEFLPGMIKPLVWSVNIPVVNSSWKRLLIELIGKDARNIEIQSLTKSFYYRAYFNMGIMGDMFELLGMPRELLELLIGLEIEKENSPRFRPGLKSIKYAPRLVLFLLKSLLFKKKIRKFLKDYEILFRDISIFISSPRDEAELLRSIDKLLAMSKNASYYVIVTVLLMGLYNRILKTLLTKRNIDPSSLNYTIVRENLSDVDPNYQLGHLHALYESLPENEKVIFQSSSLEEEYSGVLKEIGHEIQKYLQTFGHLSESGNDFSKPQWKENQELVRHMIINFKKTPEKFSSGNSSISSDNLPRSLFFRFIFRNALYYLEYRERVNHLYTYGYSLFRQHFLGLGSLWKDKNYISSEDDIFYLSREEIIEFNEDRVSSEVIKGHIERRRNEMQRFKNLRLPSVIIGDSLPPEISDNNISKIMRGVPASKGYCIGKITLIKSIEDFPKVKDGDILVIPHSDISWTPIFVNAKGVISESGGMLSHCSIIAREYNIPAVVSVPDALKLNDGSVVALDGDKGEVLIIE